MSDSSNLETYFMRDLSIDMKKDSNEARDLLQVINT